MIEKRKPTHTLTIAIPLVLPDDAEPDPELQLAFRQAMDAIMPIIRLGTLGVLAGAIQVELSKAEEIASIDMRSNKLLGLLVLLSQRG